MVGRVVISINIGLMYIKPVIYWNIYWFTVWVQQVSRLLSSPCVTTLRDGLAETSGYRWGLGLRVVYHDIPCGRGGCEVMVSELSPLHDHHSELVCVV